MKQLVINKEDLKHNINKVKEFAKDCTIIGIVKGNGYGLDLIQYSKFLANNGIEYLAVATLEEAIELSKKNICENILLLSVINDKTELEEAVKQNIILTVGSKQNAETVNELAKKGYNIKVHIKIDTGFGRYGFIYNEYEEIVQAIKSLQNSNVQIEGIFSHLADAYRKDNKHTIEQFKRFKDVLKILEENKINIKLKHICNSPAFLNYPEMHLNAVRIGSAFVGRVCAENNIGLKKIATMQVNVAEVRTVPKGFSISYLNSYKTKRETKLAILPIGHLEGYNMAVNTDMFRPIHKIIRALRELKSLLKKQKLTAVINDKRYDIIGTIGMYHTVVDVTGGNVKAGDIASLEINPLYVIKEIRREYTNE